MFAIVGGRSEELILATSQGLTESKIFEIPIRFLDENLIHPIKMSTHLSLGNIQ